MIDKSTIEESGYSTFVSNLHVNITPTQVEVEFNKFEAIKPSRVPVKSTKGVVSGYTFVEFE